MEQFANAADHKLLHITNNFVMWCKIACHVIEAKLLHMNLLLHRQSMSATSATNIMSALEVKDFQLTSPPCVEEKQPFGLCIHIKHSCSRSIWTK